MIPLRDDKPSFSTPFINYFLIGLNVLVYLWELAVGMNSPGALNAFVTQFGIVPRHAVAVLSGHSSDSPATAILPFFTSMFRQETHIEQPASTSPSTPAGPQQP